jgi:hypothetical protein
MTEQELKQYYEDQLTESAWHASSLDITRTESNKQLYKKAWLDGYKTALAKAESDRLCDDRPCFNMEH